MMTREKRLPKQEEGFTKIIFKTKRKATPYMEWRIHV
jgi:hypothetical protein